MTSLLVIKDILETRPINRRANIWADDERSADGGQRFHIAIVNDGGVLGKVWFDKPDAEALRDFLIEQLAS